MCQNLWGHNRRPGWEEEHVLWLGYESNPDSPTVQTPRTDLPRLEARGCNFALCYFPVPRKAEV